LEVVSASVPEPVILLSKSKDDLLALVQQVKPSGKNTPQVRVPMFLDRWDRFNFRHYYLGWDTPRGVKVNDYDFTADFDYAKKEGRGGILVSEKPLSLDNAEDTINTGWSDLTAHEAALRDLPVDIHMEWAAGFDPTWFLNRFSDQVPKSFHNPRASFRRGGLETPDTTPAPTEWFSSDFDDSSWPEVLGAGNDKQLWLPKQPAVFRRTFDVSPEWKANNPHVWLYVWDLSLATGAEVWTVLNGQEVGRSKVIWNTMHWSALDVSNVLKVGKNSLAIRTVQVRISYTTYLSPVAPR
jgi:hypothetical protein